MMQSTIRSWLDWKDRRDNPVFWFQRLPIWFRTRAALQADPSRNHARGPELLGSLPAPDGEPVLLACCDEIYFERFARQLAASACQASAGLHVHIHLFEPSGRCLEDAALLQHRLGNRLTFSHESAGRSPYPERSPYFFTAGRFAVAHRVLETCGVPVLLIDVDGIVHRDLVPEIESFGACDVGLILRPARKRPWRRVLACAVLLNPTPAGRRFSAQLAAAIEHVLQRAPRFHIDQTILHYLCRYYGRHPDALQLSDLGERWADSRFLPDSLIWTGKGSTRKLELARMAETLPATISGSRSIP
jgi:hypothetical protein